MAGQARCGDHVWVPLEPTGLLEEAESYPTKRGSYKKQQRPAEISN
jgi:hypothetical protein